MEQHPPAHERNKSKFEVKNFFTLLNTYFFDFAYLIPNCVIGPNLKLYINQYRDPSCWHRQIEVPKTRNF